MQVLHDAPFGHRRVRVAWRKRVWRCAEPACPVGTFTESHALAAPRVRLARCAVVWAADALGQDDTTVAALARRLDVDWHTLWRPLKVEVQRRIAEPVRLEGVAALGVDEHVWRSGQFGARPRGDLHMVDLSRDRRQRARGGVGRRGHRPALDLSGWPPGMRMIVRRERPHPGAQLRRTHADGHRLTAFATNTARAAGATLELRHRRRARAEDRIRGRQGHRAEQPAAVTTSSRTSSGARSSRSPWAWSPGPSCSH